MTRKLFRLLANSSCDHFGKVAIIPIAISMLFTLNASSASQVPQQVVEGKQTAEIAGVKFGAPQGFKLQQSTDARVALMRHATSQIVLFVAVPDYQVNDQYLTDLSNYLVSRLVPQEKSFAWKTLHRTSDRRVSLFQTSNGTMKGINETKYVQTDFIVVKAQGHEVVVGSIGTFGEEREAKFLFEVEGREYSFLGWRALFQLIATVTGERCDECTKGTGAKVELNKNW